MFESRKLCNRRSVLIFFFCTYNFVKQISLVIIFPKSINPKENICMRKFTKSGSADLVLCKRERTRRTLVLQKWLSTHGLTMKYFETSRSEQQNWKQTTCLKSKYKFKFHIHFQEPLVCWFRCMSPQTSSSKDSLMTLLRDISHKAKNSHNKYSAVQVSGHFS